MKNIDEKILMAEEKIKQLQNKRKKLISQQKQEKRKKRDRHLYEKGAVFESIFTVSKINYNLGGYKMDNKEIVKYFYEVIATKNQLDEFSRYILENCIQRYGQKRMHLGVEGMKKHFLAVRETYPDFAMKIYNQYEDKNYVISEFIMRGTHKDEFIGITPTNKVIEITGINIDKILDGKIIEHSGAASTFEAFFENGLIKPV